MIIDRIEDAKNEDIVKAVIDCKTVAFPQARKFAQRFKRRGDTDEDLVRRVWRFARNRFKYVRDGRVQKVRTPNAFWREGKGDCKSFSVFVGSVLKELGFDVQLKFTSQPGQSRPSHVYVIASKGGKTWKVDSTLPKFNREAKYDRKKTVQWK